MFKLAAYGSLAPRSSRLPFSLPKRPGRPAAVFRRRGSHRREWVSTVNMPCVPVVAVASKMHKGFIHPPAATAKPWPTLSLGTVSPCRKTVIRRNIYRSATHGRPNRGIRLHGMRQRKSTFWHWSRPRPLAWRSASGSTAVLFLPLATTVASRASLRRRRSATAGRRAHFSPCMLDCR